jgi:hypothetical protein
MRQNSLLSHLLIASFFLVAAIPTGTAWAATNWCTQPYLKMGLQLEEASGTLDDCSLEQNDGTGTGISYQETGDNTPYAVGFDGDGDYITVSDDASLDGYTEFTIGAHVNCADTQPDSGVGTVIIKNSDVGSYPIYGLYVLSSGMRLRVNTASDNNSDNYWEETTTDICNGSTYNHIAWTWVQGEDPKAYVNGALQTVDYDSDAVSGALENSTDDVILGGDGAGGSEFEGDLDDPFIMDYELDATDIADIDSNDLYQTGQYANIYTPTPSSNIADDTITFTWGGDTNAYGFVLDVGTSVGAENIWAGAVLGAEVYEKEVKYIPMDGNTLYVRLWTTNTSGWTPGTYSYEDVTYTRSTISYTNAALTSPDPNTVTVLLDTQPLEWSDPNDLNNNYWVFTCSNDDDNCDGGLNYYDSGALGENVTTATATDTNDYGDSATVYVTLGTNNQGSYKWVHYEFESMPSSATKATMSSPSPGATLTSTSQLFSWNAGTDADNYALTCGSTVGNDDYHNSTELSSATLSHTCNNLPENGSTIHVRLYTVIGANYAWYNDYTYTASTPGGGGGRKNRFFILQ